MKLKNRSEALNPVEVKELHLAQLFDVDGNYRYHHGCIVESPLGGQLHVVCVTDNITGLKHSALCALAKKALQLTNGVYIKGVLQSLTQI